MKIKTVSSYLLPIFTDKAQKQAFLHVIIPLDISRDDIQKVPEATNVIFYSNNCTIKLRVLGYFCTNL